MRRFYAAFCLRSARGTTKRMPERSSSIEQVLLSIRPSRLAWGTRHLVEVAVVAALAGDHPEVAGVAQAGPVAHERLLGLVLGLHQHDRAVELAGADEPAPEASLTSRRRPEPTSPVTSTRWSGLTPSFWTAVRWL